MNGIEFTQKLATVHFSLHFAFSFFHRISTLYSEAVLGFTDREN